MKKTISVIVAIAMMLMVSISAFAGNFDDNADLTSQQKVFAEVIFDGLNAGNNTADTLANYVGSNLDYKADVTSPATITDDVSEAFDAANEKLTVPFTDEALINSMKLRTSATITGRYQAANGEGSSNIGPGGSGSNPTAPLGAHPGQQMLPPEGSKSTTPSSGSPPHARQAMRSGI